MTIAELSSLYADTQSAFATALISGDMSEAVDLQTQFDNELKTYQVDNPSDLLFIDCVSRTITVREPIISDVEGV